MWLVFVFCSYQELPPSTRLIWRSTPAGHPRCLETACAVGLEYNHARIEERGAPSCEQLAPPPDALQNHGTAHRARTAHAAAPRAQPPLSGADAAAFASFGWEHFASMDQVARRLLRPFGARYALSSPSTSVPLNFLYSSASLTGHRYLDVTPMSALRPDAHSATFTPATRNGKNLPPDCLHWSLPRVPDTWNAVLLGALRDCG